MSKSSAAAAEAVTMDAAAITAARSVLRLYVTSRTPCSVRAIPNIRTIRGQPLEGRHDLEVVDISQHPTPAAGEPIIAAPTLIRKLPLRRFIGDMSRTDRVLIGLDLSKPVESACPAGGG